MEQAPAPLVATSQTPYSAIERLKTFTVPVAIFAKQNALGFVAGLFLLAVIIVAIAAPVVAPYSELDSNFLKLSASPDAENILGTDPLGRDVLSRVIYGARTTLIVAFAAVFAGTTTRRSFRVGKRLYWGVSSTWAFSAFWTYCSVSRPDPGLVAGGSPGAGIGHGDNCHRCDQDPLWRQSNTSGGPTNQGDGLCDCRQVHWRNA